MRSPAATNPILRQMTDGLLREARQAQLRRALYRLGEYELCEPDYKLICLWAEDLGMAPEALLGVLAQCRYEPPEEAGEPEAVEFTLENGALRSLVWDFDRLPRFPDRWVDGLRLHTLGFIWNSNQPSTHLTPKAPSLRKLYLFARPFSYLYREMPRRTLDLAGVPNLVSLGCRAFGLTELDLSPVPGLTKLYCWLNQLTELDLSPVPGLRIL